jgi:hypothetical protein
MTAAATRDDLLSVVTALTEQAATQRQLQRDYEARAITCDELTRAMYERFAAQARGTAWAFEVSADMISKYVSAP